MQELVLYMKPGCHLCEEATSLLRRLQAEFDFALRELDITLDPALQAEYGECIPVVELEGRPLLTAPFGEAMARKALEQSVRQN